MNKENTKNLPQDGDRHLDVPAEANREKHHNYLEDMEGETDNARSDRKLTDRQKQWKEGLQEGREARESS